MPKPTDYSALDAPALEAAILDAGRRQDEAKADAAAATKALDAKLTQDRLLARLGPLTPAEAALVKEGIARPEPVKAAGRAAKA